MAHPIVFTNGLLTITIDRSRALMKGYGISRVFESRLKNKIMREIGQLLESELRRAVKRNFKVRSTSPLYRAIVNEYDVRKGTLVLGLRTRGLVDPLTGRPLADYIIPIQAFPGSARRTKPPVVPLIVFANGRMLLSPIVTTRIIPWALEQGLSRDHAISIALNIQRRGVVRHKLLASVFKLKLGGTTSSIMEAVQPRLHSRVRSIIQRNVQQAIQEMNRA